MIPEQCIYVCGAYKGYCGKAEYDVEDDTFHGEVIGVRDVVTFQGRTPGSSATHLSATGDHPRRADAS